MVRVRHQKLDDQAKAKNVIKDEKGICRLAESIKYARRADK